MGFSLKSVTKGLGDVVSTVGSFIPGVGDAQAAKEANEASAKSAAGQMAFQESMSNSAYQRAVEDMKKAGLNPMLAYSQGGASVPTGASYQAQAAPRTKLAEFAMNAAQGQVRLNNESKLADNTIQDSIQNRQVQNTQSAKNLAETENIKIDTELKKKDVPASQLKHDISQKVTDIIRQVSDKMQSSAKERADQEDKKWAPHIKSMEEAIRKAKKPK